MSTKKNIIFNGIASVGSKGVRVAEQLLLVPFFLSAWGAAYYGEWLTLSIIPSILAFSDLGIGTAAANSFVLTYLSGEKKRASDIFRTGLWLVSSVVVLGFILCLVILLLAHNGGVLVKSLISPSDIIYSVLFLMASQFLRFYCHLFEAFYKAKLYNATSINLISIESLLKIIAALIVLHYGFGVVELSFSYFVVSVIFNVSYAIYAKRIIGFLPDGQYVSVEAKQIVTKGLGFLLSPVWQAIYFQGSTFVVRIVLGPESVAIFNTIRTACRSINQIFTVVNQSSFPEIQYAIGCGDIQKAQRLFVRSMQFVLLCAIVGTSFLMLFGLGIYEWWTNKMLSVPDNIWYVFISGIVFNAAWWTSGDIFKVINEPFKYTFCGFICACISIPLSYLLSLYWGLIGAALGYVAMDIMMSSYIFPMSFKRIGLHIGDLFRMKL